ncbi:lytic transglycosylase domain-containing protein [Aliiruegeria haliotis]|nr:lytic transglycosylase domain-containing protein [Aliiruegeria haliotis]
MRCTVDGRHCIALESYIPDVCRVIEATAAEAGLDTGFFARLLWKESLYNASAVSPAGAEGIAQFMPGTARLRGLQDAFNPARAMEASAIYLAELRDMYGNLGLAAAAYNAGEARVDDFLARGRRLPPETRRYVRAITGYTGDEWKDTPPEDLDLRLDKEMPFQQACVTLASNRRLREFRVPASRSPWGVIVASHRSRDITEYRYRQFAKRSATLRGFDVSFVHMRLPSRHGRQYTAQIGAATRKEANGICGTLRKAGVNCLVLRN